LGLEGNDHAMLDQEQSEIPIVHLAVSPKAARLLDPVYAGLDLLPQLPYVELKQHLIAGLRRDVGMQ